MSLPTDHIAKIIEDFILTIRAMSVVVLPHYVTKHETDPGKLFLFIRDKLLSENQTEIVNCLSQIRKIRNNAARGRPISDEELSQFHMAIKKLSDWCQDKIPDMGTIQPNVPKINMLRYPMAAQSLIDGVWQGLLHTLKKSQWRDAIKNKQVEVLSGKYTGQTLIFIKWNGHNTVLHCPKTSKVIRLSLEINVRFTVK